MAVVVSNATLMDMPANWWPTSTGSLTLYDSYTYDYATMYRTQPNVRTCVDFLARNVAQLGLHVFRRVSDTDRVRLTDHPLAEVLAQPLPADYKVTTYRLIESLMADLGIYFNAYWLKIRVEGQPAGLLRVPPMYVTIYGGFVPEYYVVNLGTELRTIQPDEIVHLRGYNPDSPITGLSPLETLRRVLAEEAAAGEYREHFWQNAARMSGIIERPKDAPEWSNDARLRFKADFEAMYSGGENSGKTAILEEGMQWKEASFNAQESEYLSGRKLTREECARAYHIPLPMVGILDHATFSNIREQHKNLYQDSLGPWLAMIEQDIMLQLLPEFADTNGVYVEFNIAEKLQGSFEEQVAALQVAVGRPWMTANEARARMNLPRADGADADELVVPLNMMTDGDADRAEPEGAREEEEEDAPKGLGAKARRRRGIDTHRPELRAQFEKRWQIALARHYRRQQAAMVSRVPGKSDIGGIWWDDDRWVQELYQDLLKLNRATAQAWADALADAAASDYSVDRMMPWLEQHSQVQSTYLNEQVRDAVAKALEDPEPLDAVKHVFEMAIAGWALREAISAVTSAASFGSNEAANAAGLRTKTWRVNSGNPRDTHAALNGVSVGIRDRFPNGLRWPGDPAGTAEDNANCECSVDFGR